MSGDHTSTTSSQLELDVYESTTTASSMIIDELTDKYATITTRMRVLNSDVAEGRREVRRWNLDERTTAKARSDVAAILEELAYERGFAWSDIARLASVSVSAVRKWRKGETPSPEHRRALARLAAFVDLLDEVGPVGDPAGWLAMRLSDGHTVTPSDLYLAGMTDGLLEHAEGHIGAHQLLDSWNPDWRDETRTDWRIVEAADGDRSIVRRS